MHVPIVLHQKKHPWPELGIARGDGRVTWKENDSAHVHLSAKTLRPAVFSPRLDHRDVQHIFQWCAGGGRVWGLGRYAQIYGQWAIITFDSSLLTSHSIYAAQNRTQNPFQPALLTQKFSPFLRNPAGLHILYWRAACCQHPAKYGSAGQAS